MYRIFYKKDKIQWRKIKDLTGRRVGKLTVTGFYHSKNKYNYWKCLCDCGNYTIINTAYLSDGKIKSCGCLKHVHSNNFQELKCGQKFHNWEIIKYTRTINKKAYYLCKCICGAVKEVNANNLLTGKTTGCGCTRHTINASHAEKELYKFLHDEFPFLEIEKHNKTILRGKELDIYIPEKKTAIEYNGSLWHASNNDIFGSKPKNYHQQKFLRCKKQGISLISIFEYDWVKHKDFILHYLKSKICGKKLKFKKDYIKTNNDFGIIQIEGYREVKQLNPSYYKYRNFIVYRSGQTLWKRVK